MSEAKRLSEESLAEIQLCVDDFRNWGYESSLLAHIAALEQDVKRLESRVEKLRDALDLGECKFGWGDNTTRCNPTCQACNSKKELAADDRLAKGKT